MKRAIWIFVIIFSLLLTGCGSWMDSTYTYTTPHIEHTTPTTQDYTTVGSYDEILLAICEMIERGAPSGILYYTSEYELPALTDDLKHAISSAKTETPIGSYAVEDITYEIGVNAGKEAIAINITYRHNRSEILSIGKASNMGDVCSAIYAALDKCDANTVIRVSAYEETDFSQIIEDYAKLYPEIVMEVPMVTFVTYPDSGRERILEISYNYQTSREMLRSMRTVVEPVFSSAALYVSDDSEDLEKYSQLYSFLMQRHNYRFDTSITPCYSLLRHGTGNSQAFATVYASMCRRAGLVCLSVSGTYRGEPHYWNIVCIDGVYYHVDLLACLNSDSFTINLDNDMAGYIWNYSAYPVCDGESTDPRQQPE